MHLYLSHNPRTLYLVTGLHDERKGRPQRALVFRAAETNPAQVIVEFLPKDEVNLTGAVSLTTRVIKGCLGLISIEDGMLICMSIWLNLIIITYRYFSRGGFLCDGGRKDPPIRLST
jgi:hypothetical protein